ncbi:class I SAM-dependent methyltransferase [Sphingobium sp. CR28]|uniref:class I SAM-dependent methyltransferase n=1 Tax=Sphingobium sp. CR28 TaxID=3400272 RepID=UPI003FED97DB
MHQHCSATAQRPSRASDYVRFLHAWVRRPRQNGSIVPSSQYLGRMMAAQIDPGAGRVMELGGGTGALTREILATGLPADQLEIVEINAEFARDLRRDFPGTTVLETPAQAICTQAAGGAGGYQAIISGLPMLAMSKSLQRAILAEAFKLLMPGGVLVQFTYSLRPPIAREVYESLDLDVRRVGHIVRNFPPATVFRFSRNAE